MNLLAPGTIDTELLRLTRFPDSADQDADVAALGREQPLGRLGRPDDIASAAVYLASDESSWLSGAKLIVDGGQAMWPKPTASQRH